MCCFLRKFFTEAEVEYFEEYIGVLKFTLIQHELCNDKIKLFENCIHKKSKVKLKKSLTAHNEHSMYKILL